MHVQYSTSNGHMV